MSPFDGANITYEIIIAYLRAEYHHFPQKCYVSILHPFSARIRSIAAATPSSALVSVCRLQIALTASLACPWRSADRPHAAFPDRFRCPRSPLRATGRCQLPGTAFPARPLVPRWRDHFNIIRRRAHHAHARDLPDLVAHHFQGDWVFAAGENLIHRHMSIRDKLRNRRNHPLGRR